MFHSAVAAAETGLCLVGERDDVRRLTMAAWLAQMMHGPALGTLSRPSMRSPKTTRIKTPLSATPSRRIAVVRGQKQSDCTPMLRSAPSPGLYRVSSASEGIINGC